MKFGRSQQRGRWTLVLVLILPTCRRVSSISTQKQQSRREFGIRVISGAVWSSPLFPGSGVAVSDGDDHDGIRRIGGENRSASFRSLAYEKSEYTNSIVASRDTNISPQEVYDTLLEKLGPVPRKLGVGDDHGEPKRALDCGAGAGVSTQVLFQMGFTEIDAIDWSGEAWKKNVLECPDGVRFYELDDERFLSRWQSGDNSSVLRPKRKYDCVAFNFAVNKSKAVSFAKQLLKDDGILLAPINSQDDYWLKQTYTLVDARGQILWTAMDVGAWSVQFQPDVTQDTCQGVWCAPFNGFKKLR